MTMNGRMKQKKKKMEKTVKIEGLDNRRYHIKTSTFRNSFNVIISIQTRKEFVWNNLYSECYITTDDSLLDTINKYEEGELFIITDGIKIHKYHQLTFENYNVVNMFQNIEESYSKYKKSDDEKQIFIKDKIAPNIVKIEQELNSIGTIGYEEGEEGDV